MNRFYEFSKSLSINCQKLNIKCVVSSKYENTCELFADLYNIKIQTTRRTPIPNLVLINSQQNVYLNCFEFLGLQSTSTVHKATAIQNPKCERNFSVSRRAVYFYWVDTQYTIKCHIRVIFWRT